MIRIDQQLVSRRTFMQAVVGLVGLAIIPFHHWIGGPLFQQAVFRMRPLSGVRYSRAAWNHMNNRLFASRAELVSELPHRGMVFAIEQVPVSLSAAELEKLFGGRPSLDKRRIKDRAAHDRIFAAVQQQGKLRAA